ncbi:MAG: GTP-binding protein [Alphaproteobacteria bacterium]|nr:GTP-binding protein [Alphaproteobacteria bacterium]
MQGPDAQTGQLIPVTVLTGFLGSGKTTLLASLLQRPELADTAVVVNEFGEIGLDHLLLAKGDENVVLLDSGCLCCTVANSLSETLGDLHFRAARGELPRFKRTVIETTGLAEPAPILQMLMTDYLVTAHYALDGVVTTIDAALGAGQLDAHPEAVRQAAMADRLVVTKGDLAGAPAVAALRQRLAALNPSAPVVEAVRGEDLDPARLLNIGLFDAERRSVEARRWLRDEALADAAEHDPHQHRHDRVRSFSICLERPVTWPGYAAWVEALRCLRGPDLLRIKGLIAIDDPARPYVVQAVQHVFSPPLRLPAWPSEDRRSRLVFITNGLDRPTLEPSLRLLHDPATAWAEAVDNAIASSSSSIVGSSGCG